MNDPRLDTTLGLMKGYHETVQKLAEVLGIEIEVPFSLTQIAKVLRAKREENPSFVKELDETTVGKAIEQIKLIDVMAINVVLGEDKSSYNFLLVLFGIALPEIL